MYPPTQDSGVQGAGEKIRCVLVHEHVLLRQGLRRLLEDERDMEVVAECGDAAEALQSVYEHRPDVVLADGGIFGCAPEQAEQLILQQSPDTKVVFLAAHPDHPVPNGVRSTLRDTSAEELVEMVRGMCSAVWLEQDRRTWPIGEPLPRKRVLTDREREVLKLLAEGRTVRSTADVLGLSAKTVDAHKFNLMRKLGIHNKAELVMWAIQKKVVKVPLDS